MPLPTTYYKITLHFRNTLTSAKANCVLWYLPTSTGSAAPTLTTIATFANNAKTAFSTAISGSTTSDCEMSGLTLKYVNGGAEVEGDNNNGAIGGTESADTLPEEDVYCIQRRTGGIGRNRRGRVFFPFVPVSFVALGGELTTNGKAAAAALATMVKSSLTMNGIPFTPQTIDWKNGQCVPVVQTGYVTATCSRRDRRFPKTLTSVRI
jgi:hypothetical protein